jgi:hypothetical protein
LLFVKQQRRKEMSIELEIRDGDPWYLSPDIWTVPGDDPEAATGLPIAGSPCFLWARVRNNGTSKATDATVRFYWANPAVGFNRSTANIIGSSFVSLNGGETQDVLCLTPWVPAFINNGHACVLAEAFHALDGLPPGLDFNVPTDRHTAQRNLQIVLALKRTFHFAFEVHNPSRSENAFSLHAKVGRVKELRKLLPHLGRSFELPNENGQVEYMGFVDALCPAAEEFEQAQPQIEKLVVPGMGRASLSLVGRLDGAAALIHVVQRIGKRTVGGLSALVIQGGGKQ